MLKFGCFYLPIKIRKTLKGSINPLKSGVRKKVTHTQTNLQLKATSLFKNVYDLLVEIRH